jgi:hypothetical protein
MSLTRCEGLAEALFMPESLERSLRSASRNYG